MGVYYTRYDGEGWSEKEYVPGSEDPEIYAWRPITADSGGGVWIGWTGWGETGIGFYYWQALCNHYRDGEWSGRHQISDNTEEEEHRLTAMSTDADGRVWVGWGTGYDPLLEVAYYDGVNWSEAMIVGQSGSYYLATWLMFGPDHEGGMWLAWNHIGKNDTNYIEARYWDGEELSSTDTIAVDGGSATVAVDDYNNAWAVFAKNEDIYYSVITGSGWSEPAPVDTNPAVDQWPDIAVDSAGRIWCVWASDREGDWGIYASYTTGVGVEEPVTHQPPSTTIESIYPNPFQSATTISYSVANGSQHVEMSVFDVSGREVKTLASGEKTPGYYEVIWNGKDNKGLRCSSGVYFIRMYSNEFNANARIVLLR
jgi:hypothetical protein